MRLIVIIAIGLSLYLYFKGKDAGKNGKNNASPIIGKTLFEEGKASGYSAKQNAAGLVTYPKEFWKQDVVKIDTAGKTPKQIIDDAISRLNKEDEDRPEKAKIYIQRESGTNIKIFFTRFLIHKSSLGLENGQTLFSVSVLTAWCRLNIATEEPLKKKAILRILKRLKSCHLLM